MSHHCHRRRPPLRRLMLQIRKPWKIKNKTRFGTVDRTAGWLDPNNLFFFTCKFVPRLTQFVNFGFVNSLYRNTCPRAKTHRCVARKTNKKKIMMSISLLANQNKSIARYTVWQEACLLGFCLPSLPGHYGNAWEEDLLALVHFSALHLQCV